MCLGLIDFQFSKVLRSDYDLMLSEEATDDAVREALERSLASLREERLKLMWEDGLPDHLAEKRVFTSVITLTYRLMVS